MCTWAVNSPSLRMKRETGKSASPSAVKGQKQVTSVLIAKLFTCQSTVLDVFIHWNSIRTQCFTWLRIWYVWVMSLSIQLQSIKKPSKMWLATRTSLPTHPTPSQHRSIQSTAPSPPPHKLWTERGLRFFKYKEQKGPLLCRLPAPPVVWPAPLLTPGKPRPVLCLGWLWPERSSAQGYGYTE